MMKYNSILKKVYMLNLKVGQLSGLVNCPGWPIVRKCKGWSIVRGWPIVRVGQLSGCPVRALLHAFSYWKCQEMCEGGL